MKKTDKQNNTKIEYSNQKREGKPSKSPNSAFHA